MEIERHIRRREIELGQSIAGRTKIYLDACFWIIVRDVALGVRTGAAERKLLHFLHRGVANGALICPISASLFMELMKQPYTPSRRIATARLIDDLSLGVSMIAPKALMRTEINAFLMASRGSVSHYPLQYLIWTKVGYVLGNIYPSIKQMSEAEELQLQIAFFDHLWHQPLTSIVETIADAPVPGDDFRDLSRNTNEQRVIHNEELKSFRGTYDIELRGAVEIAGEIAADILTDLAEKDAGQSLSPTPDERAEVTNMGRNLLYFSMKKPEHRAVLRTIHIGAALHASMRWDKKRKYRPNDYYDFEHATAAMAYCDLFLTEGPLHVMVTGPQVNLEAINGCKVISNVADAVEFLRIGSRPHQRRCA
jgi:hypothetical protein